MKISWLNKIKEWLKEFKTTGHETLTEQPSTKDQNSSQQLKPVNMELSQLVKQGKIPGMAISIYRGREMLLSKGYGYANLKHKKPIDPTKTLFRSASVSKPITACGLAAMIAEGLIHLDSSIYEYVPYFPKKTYDFTIRQLATHTAGIRGYKGKEYALNKPYTIRESLQVFEKDPLLYQPGTQFHYNSFGYVLLSLAMEEAAGVPFADYIREKVLVPLHMTNTFPEDPKTNNKQRATFYSKWASGFRKATLVDNRFKLAGGGYLTTTEDLVKLGHAILDNSFYPEVMSAFLEAQKANGINTYYGLGWEVSEDAEGRRFYGHIGNQVGGYSYFRIFPDSGLVLAALVNCADPKIQDRLDELVTLFYVKDI